MLFGLSLIHICKILYVDTEQSKYHCHKVMERILRLAGLPTDKDVDDFVFIVLREQTPDKRKQIIGYMLENMPDVGLLIIDGIRDLMYDINSPSESTAVSYTHLERGNRTRYSHDARRFCSPLENHSSTGDGHL